jgi:hypothetical protein
MEKNGKLFGFSIQNVVELFPCINVFYKCFFTERKKKTPSSFSKQIEEIENKFLLFLPHE